MLLSSCENDGAKSLIPNPHVHSHVFQTEKKEPLSSRYAKAPRFTAESEIFSPVKFEGCRGPSEGV